MSRVATRRSVYAGHPIFLTGARGPSFFLLAPPDNASRGHKTSGIPVTRERANQALAEVMASLRIKTSKSGGKFYTRVSPVPPVLAFSRRGSSDSSPIA